jgi:hypothetical protein
VLRAAYYREALHHWIAALGRRREAVAADAGAWSREQCENLKALGYIGANVPCPE